jgi:hypothetical protein
VRKPDIWTILFSGQLTSSRFMGINQEKDEIRIFPKVKKISQHKKEAPSLCGAEPTLPSLVASRPQLNGMLNDGNNQDGGAVSKGSRGDHRR